MVKSFAQELLTEQKHKTHVTAAWFCLRHEQYCAVYIAARCCAPTLFEALSRVQPRPAVRAVPGEVGHKSGKVREEGDERSVVGRRSHSLSVSLRVLRFGNEDAPHSNSAAYSAPACLGVQCHRLHSLPKGREKVVPAAAASIVGKADAAQSVGGLVPPCWHRIDQGRSYTLPLLYEDGPISDIESTPSLVEKDFIPYIPILSTLARVGCSAHYLPSSRMCCAAGCGKLLQ